MTGTVGRSERPPGRVSHEQPQQRRRWRSGAERARACWSFAMATASKPIGGASDATNSKFFRGVRADALKRYQLLNHIGRGACACATAPHVCRARPFHA